MKSGTFYDGPFRCILADVSRGAPFRCASGTSIISHISCWLLRPRSRTSSMSCKHLQRSIPCSIRLSFTLLRSSLRFLLSTCDEVGYKRIPSSYEGNLLAYLQSISPPARLVLLWSYHLMNLHGGVSFRTRLPCLTGRHLFFLLRFLCLLVVFD